MAIGLLDMPLEVLQDIIRMLCPHCDGEQANIERYQVTYPTTQDDQRWRAGIANYVPMGGLSQASRLLRSLVLPVLYHRVVIQSWPRDELFPLTRFFCQHPNLASQVKEISILEIKGENKRSDFSDADINFIESAFERMGSCMPQLETTSMLKLGGFMLHLIDVPKEQNRELRPLLIDLLVSQTTLVEYLMVEGTESQPLGRHISTSSKLGALEHLEIRRDEEDEGMVTLYEQSELLQLAPNLRSMKVGLCASIPRTPSMENMQFLNLIDGKLGYDDIMTLPTFCPRLKSFSYSSGGFSGEEYDDHQRFSGRELCWALRPWRTTLRVLDVDLCGNQRNDLGDMMDNLRENSALETICLGWNCLFPEEFYGTPPARPSQLVELLPRSVKSLSFGDVSDAEYPALVHFSKAVLQGEFPHLKRVRYRNQCMASSSLEINDVFQRAGVDAR